jgi:hypothetical protein
MSFSERDVQMNKLFFFEGLDSITIGDNVIPKQIYLDNKKDFDLLIEIGDDAWRYKISDDELIQFVVGLGLNKIKSEDKLTLPSAECKGENMDMKELAKQEEIRNGFDNIPVGMTKLVANSIDITPIEVEFNGVKKTRYELKAKTTEGKEVHFGCGVQIYNGLIASAKVPGAKIVYITRNGTTKDDTKYTVVAE